MADDALQKTIFTELQRFVRPITSTEGDPERVLALFSRAGWDIPALLAGGSSAQFVAGVDAIAVHGRELQALIDNPPEEFEDFFMALGEKALPIFANLAAILTSLPGGLPASVQELPGDLLNTLTLDYLRRRAPVVYQVLVLFGLISKGAETVESQGGVPFRVKNAQPSLQLDQLNRIVKDPAKAILDVYWPAGFADNGAGALKLAGVLIDLLAAIGVARERSGALRGDDDDPGVQLFVDGNKVRIAKAFALDDYGSASVGAEVEFQDGPAGPVVIVTPLGTWQISQGLGGVLLTLQGSLAGAALRIASDGVEPFNTTTAALDMKLSLQRDASAGEYVFLFGSADSTHLLLENFVFSTRVVVAAAQKSFAIGGAIRGLELQLGGGSGDGFLQKLLPPDGITSTLDLEVEWSTNGGLAFKGGSLEIQIPTHIEIGPIELQSATIAVKIDAPEIPVDLGVTVRGNLGPLVVIVENIGLRATFSFPRGGGNLGPMDMELGFKPPNGVGMSLDAGAVKGGGYLYFDFDKGEYAGALELTIADFLSLKAIGLITTKMPDGSPGFSLLIIITAEFSPGFQLGYGFVLIGVGGLLGLNRTVILEALAAGVRSGAVNGILFPVDPVANAPRIISDLRTIFPPVLNHFLIGPMAKIGWTTLISLELGIIIEIPGNIAILGVLRAGLGDNGGEPILQLQVNFIGALEFDKKRGWFFAALFESRLLFIALEGEMGLLIAVGDDANFVLSVGGFHPSFEPPPLPFPSPRRIALNIIDTQYARIRADTYFAITPNTAQLGCSAELFFGFDSFSVEGHFAFDVLIRFSPFYLIAELRADVSLKVGGVGVFTIDLEFTLEGPTPWRARGRGTLQVFCLKVSADFDKTFGEASHTTLPPLAIIPMLLAELENPANWRVLPPPAHNLMVALRPLDAQVDPCVLHPLGTLEVSQGAIPLLMTLDTVGAQKPDDANRFELRVASAGLGKRDDARRPFSPAQFRTMTDAQKLSSPPYQREPSGIVLGVTGAEVRTGRAVKRVLRYEVTTVDTLYRRVRRRFITLGDRLFRHFAKGNAAARSALSRGRAREIQPFADRITVGGERYAVAALDTNRPIAGGASFASEGAAREWLAGAVAADPNLAASLHVVPASDLGAAA
jgi:hypothetical protein